MEVKKVKKGICFEVSTTDFNHAVKVCELAYGYEGVEWNEVKESNSMTTLVDYLKADGLSFSTFNLYE